MHTNKDLDFRQTLVDQCVLHCFENATVHVVADHVTGSFAYYRSIFREGGGEERGKGGKQRWWEGGRGLGSSFWTWGESSPTSDVD